MPWRAREVAQQPRTSSLAAESSAPVGSSASSSGGRADHGTGDRHPLALAARELGRQVGAALVEPDVRERRPGAREPLRARRRTSGISGTSTFSSAVSPGIRWCSWKTTPTTSRRKLAGSSKVGDGSPAHGDAAGVGTVEARDEVQQRALPRPRGTGQQHDLAGPEAQRDARERADPVAEALLDALDDDVDAAAQIPSSSHCSPDFVSDVRPVKPSLASVGVVP